MILLISKSVQKIGDLKKKLNSMFDTKDLGPTRRSLGMIIVRDICPKFGNTNCKHVSLPLSTHHFLSKSQCPKSNS